MNKTLLAGLLVLATAGAQADQPPAGGQAQGPTDQQMQGKMQDKMRDGWMPGAMHREHFKAIDKDGDGRISREEARAGAIERAERHFEKLDGNKDGFVTTEEMSEARAAKRAKMRERMEARFKSADTDGDGAISKAEAEAGMPMLNRRFASIDADANGKLTPEELRAHHAKRHEQDGQDADEE